MIKLFNFNCWVNNSFSNWKVISWLWNANINSSTLIAPLNIFFEYGFRKDIHEYHQSILWNRLISWAPCSYWEGLFNGHNHLLQQIQLKVHLLIFHFFCDKTRVWAVVYESVVFWNWLLIMINWSQERCCVPIYVHLWCTDVSWCKITEKINLQNSPPTFKKVMPPGFQGCPENWAGINFPNKRPKGMLLGSSMNILDPL